MSVNLRPQIGGKVFGIGLSRTGTMSLSDALNQIGFRSVHFPHDSATRSEITQFIRGGTLAPCSSVLSFADAITDTPATISFEALDKSYPGSRFILTVRDEEEWLQSCRDFWDMVINPQRESEPRSPVSVYAGAINQVLYGSEDFEPEKFRRVKREFEQRVQEYFHGREESLLVLDICGGQGWSEVCSFLGKPIPGDRFPHAHKRESVA